MIYLYYSPYTFRCRKWVINTRRADLLDKTTNYLYGLVLCAQHFEANQFMNPSERNKLIWNAVPTLFWYPNPPARLAQKRPAPTARTEPPFKVKCKAKTNIADGDFPPFSLYKVLQCFISWMVFLFACFWSYYFKFKLIELIFKFSPQFTDYGRWANIYSTFDNTMLYSCIVFSLLPVELCRSLLLCHALWLDLL